ncbi:lysozyme inhibitor LprI family protein [Cereibacter sp. SYSU M97828]|nr:lysozyme inhibitor LprI family protein [Cereibacter flavus]
MYRILALTLLLPLPLAAQEADCANAVTQAQMTQCAAQELGAADDALNAAFGKAMTRMGGVDGGEDALRRAQRAWISFRDTACAAEGLRYAGGSMQGMVVVNCKTRLTDVRTADLRALAEGS